MRPPDELPLDPEIEAELAAIDLALDGDPVEPEFAEIAELTVLLVDERPLLRPEFAQTLDLRASRRFGPATDRDRSTAGASSGSWGSRIRAVVATPGLGVALVPLVLVAVIVGVISLGGLHGGGSSASSTNGQVASGPARVSGHLGAEAAPGKTHAGSAVTSASGGGSASGVAGSPSSPSSSAAATTPSVAPSPDTSGRKVIQGAQLALQAPSARIDNVASEVYNVVSAQNGIVEQSHVTSATGSAQQSYATFNLSIPTANLEAALAGLSSLRYTHVVSRSDSSQDVTGTYHNDQQQLQDAQTLRTSLLKQLANATTQAQIDSLKAQLRDAEAQIASAQSTLKHLQRQVAYSTVMVQLNAGAEVVPVSTAHSGGGFTIGQAVHDAWRVLVVAAGVLLIALAVMIPVGLVAALIAWIVMAIRQRQREQALDRG